MDERDDNEEEDLLPPLTTVVQVFWSDPGGCEEVEGDVGLVNECALEMVDLFVVVEGSKTCRSSVSSPVSGTSTPASLSSGGVLSLPSLLASPFAVVVGDDEVVVVDVNVDDGADWKTVSTFQGGPRNRISRLNTSCRQITTMNDMYCRRITLII